MSTTPAPAAPRARTGVIIGFLIAGAALIGISIFAQSIRKGAETVVPPRVILTDTIDANARDSVRFVTPARLSLGSMGWAADGLHPHLRLDSVDLMAGASDIARIAGDTFVWVLPPQSTGVHSVTLFWADMSHRPVGDSVHGTLTAIPLPR
jgi:hypothetical protein